VYADSLYYGRQTHVTLGGLLYFAANDGANGTELWRTDGTTDGTTIVKDIVAGEGPSWPWQLVTVDNSLYFVVNGTELWKSDGTADGTALVKQFSIYLSDLTVVGNTIYFGTDDGTSGRELWKSDGTGEGTVLVKDIAMGPGNSNPWYLTAVGSKLFFTAND